MKFDHIAVAAETLAKATSHAEASLGVALQPGGEHAVFHTHNTLLGLEDGLYLEAIAINPDAPRPERPRWFDLDRFFGPARLTNWICACDDLDATLAALPEGFGEPVALQRGDLRWRMAVPQSGILPFDNCAPALIEWGFVAQVVPQMIIIVFLAMLYVSMMLTTLKATSEEKLDISAEFKVTSAGNIPAVALCAPPVYTDIVATRMYREFGASSRWLPLISATIALCVAMFGGAIVTWLPKLLMPGAF